MPAIGKLNVQIGVDLNKFRTDFNRALNIVNTNTAEIKKSLTSMQSEFKGVTTSIKGIGGAMAAIMAVKVIADIAVGVAGLAKDVLFAADSFNQLTAKVKGSLDSASQFDSIFKQLIDSSNRTGTAVNDVAQAFVRIRPAAETLGVSNEQLIQFNETFAKMGALAGATSTEMSQTMIQLSQAIASNRLGGDELRSVMEQMPGVARTIADSMGIPLSKLKDVAKDGKITADVVFNAILGKTKEVDAKFSQLPPSIDRSITRMNNSVQKFIGELNKATDATTIVSKTLDDLAGFVDQNSAAFADLVAQILRATVELLKANPMFWGLGDAIERLTKINASEWMLGVASGLDVITTKALQAGNEISRFMATIGNTLAAHGDRKLFEKMDTATTAKFDLKQKDLASELAKRQNERIRALMAPVIPSGFSSSHSRKISIPSINNGSNSSSKGGGKAAKEKTDPDISAAKQLADSLKSVWQQEAQEIANAQRFLQKHLITVEQYNDAVLKAKRDAHDAFKIEGVKDAVEGFMKPHQDFLSGFKTDLGDALSDPAFQKRMDIQKFTDDISRQIQETQRLTDAKKLGTDAYEQMVKQIQAENDVRSLGIDLMSDEGKLLLDLSMHGQTLQSSYQKLQTQMQSFGQVGQQVAGIISGGLEDMIFQGGKFSDVLKNMALNMAGLIFQEGVSKPLAKGASSLFSNIGAKLFKGFKGFASGGDTPTNQPFWVGENGPELMSANKSYRVFDHQTSMAMAGGGGAVHLNQYFTIQTIDNRDFEDRLSQHAKFIGNVSVQAIQRQENRMGRRGPMDTTRG